MKKILALALIALSSLSFAGDQVSVMGKYVDQSGDNYVDFSVNDFTPQGIIDFNGRLAEEDQKYHTGFVMELKFDEYKKIFESDRDVTLSLNDRSDDKCKVTATSNGNVRTVVLNTEVYNDNVYLANKVFTMTIIDGELVEIRHKVKRKKHVLILLTVPGMFDYADVGAVVTQEREGLGVYADNPGWPIGKILSFENIEKELADYGTSDKYTE